MLRSCAQGGELHCTSLESSSLLPSCLACDTSAIRCWTLVSGGVVSFCSSARPTLCSAYMLRSCAQCGELHCMVLEFLASARPTLVSGDTLRSCAQGGELHCMSL